MLIYSLQAISLGVLLWFLSQSSHRTDVPMAVYVCVWTLGVIAIYWKFGDAQDIFYSDDQMVQVNLVNHVSQNPLVYSLQGIVGLRYVITIPASLLTRIGIDTLLVLKFLQAIFFVLTYRLVREHFRIENLKFKVWHLTLFAGPLFVFMSLLGLRDLALAYFALYLIIGRDPRVLAISWISLFLLRPHLAIALVFGRVIGFAFERARFGIHQLFIPLIVVISFISGTYAYMIGRHFQMNAPLDFFSLSHLGTQSDFNRLFANFGGLQFLLFGSDTVNLPTINLIFLRILFFDTFLIPILFLWTVVSTSALQKHAVNILASFTFFLGLVSVTEFNSTRQNLPFLVLMGVTVVVHLADRGRSESHLQATESVPSDISSAHFFRDS
ncbi:MAG: hypothetical protein ABIQ38_05585 [Ilumatobacteraceae bacterium]